ncbi:MAG TPA: hypothetical protein PK303_00775 [bacterium]|nr:hypothetical protein [bacterium]HOL35647.1 hypothetical protein [bacterium]HPP07639.1 hypothetical protein [bacterium]
MLYLCLDENGYGPVMGPLVVTGVSGTADSEKFPEQIFDSKRLFSSRNSFPKIERIALSIFKIAYNRFPFTYNELFERSFECVNGNSGICWKNFPEIPFSSDKVEIENYASNLQEYLKKNHICLLSIHSQVLCVQAFNNLSRKHLKKDFINYLMFEKIILKHQKDYDHIVVKAGKIGGRNYYKKFLTSSFRHWEIHCQKENTAASEYLIKKDRKQILLTFLKNIESISFLGILAGIYGKYIRELFMIAINKFFDTEKFISGYRDAYTRQLVAQLKMKDTEFQNCICRMK